MDPSAGAITPAIQVQVLGGFAVTVAGQPVDPDAWRRRKARQLFKCLLTQPQRRLSKDEALELFWPDSEAVAAATNLRTTVHAIRRVLELPGQQATAVIGVDPDSVFCRGGDVVSVDADAFERQAALALRSGEPAELERAVRLYAGPFLPEDVYEDWASERRQRLKRLWSEVAFALARRQEQAGDLEAAAGVLQRLAEADHCDERAAEELMRVDLQRGLRSDALRVFRQLERALREELGVEPSEAARELERQAAAGEAAPPIPGSRFRCSYPFSEPAAFVGREVELGRLARVLERGRGGGQAVVIGAPAGTGKSALVGRLARGAQEAGYLCLAGGCYEERGGLPLGPFHDALADYLLTLAPATLEAELGSVLTDLTSVVPELSYHLPTGGEAAVEPVDRTRLFGVVLSTLRTLAQRAPVLLCLEDLHAADAATLYLLHYVVRQSRRLRLVVLATYRSEEVPAESPLALLLTALQRERLADHLRLEPLTRAQTASLVASLAGGPASHDLTEMLYSTTEGNPLFLEQLVLALREQGQLRHLGGVWQPAERWGRAVPTIVRDVIGQRLTRLSSAARETLAMAAVLGQTFDYSVLLSALEPAAEADVLGQLDEALRASVLRATAAGYSFGHNLLREAMYWSLTPPRRTLLHARAALTLERLAGEHADAQPAELAHHFALAGQSPDVRAKALHYGLLAGRQAAAVSCFREALVHYRNVCQLLERQGEPASSERYLDALEGRGTAERGMALWLDAIGSFRRLVELSQEPLRRARARRQVAYALHHTGDTQLALAECTAGLTELEQAPAGPATVAAQLAIQYLVALLTYYRGQYHQVAQLGEEMLDRAQALGEPGSLFLAHSVLAWADWGQGHVQAGLDRYELARAAAERGADKIEMAIAHENLGVLSFLGGRLDAARTELELANAIYRDSANELRAVNTLQFQSRVELAEGELERAQERAELALAVSVNARERWAADCQEVLGTICAVRCDWPAAIDLLQAALELRQRVGYAANVVDTLLALGDVELHRGRWSEAERCYGQGLEAALAMDPSPQLVAAYRRLARLHLRRAQLADAKATAVQPDGERQATLGQPGQLAESELARRQTGELGQTEVRDGPLAEAEVLLERALALAGVGEEMLEWGAVLSVAAELAAERGELERAAALAEQALARAPWPSCVEDQVLLAELNLRCGRVEQAATLADAAVQAAERAEAPRHRALAALVQARLAAHRATAGHATRTEAGQAHRTGVSVASSSDADDAERWFSVALDAATQASAPYARLQVLRAQAAFLRARPADAARASDLDRLAGALAGTLRAS